MRGKKSKPFGSIWEFDIDKLTRGLRPVFPPFIIIKEKEWTPAIDIFEVDDNIIVRAELSGVDQSNLKIEIVGQMLIITGERCDNYDDTRDVFHQIEIDFGRFHRQLELPCEVDTKRTTAIMENGFLVLKLPKTNTDKKVIHIPIE